MITNPPQQKKKIGMENQIKIHTTKNNFFSESVTIKCHTDIKYLVFKSMNM